MLFAFGRLRQILVVHIKRFNYTAYSRDKVNTLVRFPVKGLDLSPFVSHAEDRAEHGRPIYDLYGVSNHMGVLGGGHYTATCMDDSTEKWFNFNDSTVSDADVSETQSSVAYVLFYKQRSRERAP